MINGRASQALSVNVFMTREILDDIYEIYAENIERHIDVLCRKYRQSIYKDDYGNVKLDEFARHIEYFIKNVVMDSDECQALSADAHGCLEETWHFFVSFITNVVAQNCPASPIAGVARDMDGEEYERLVADMFSECGWQVSFTPRTGDQGVDLVVERGSRRIAVQCKRYKGSVGNDAIQQAHSGSIFYECVESIVVTSGTYTRAALQLANSLGVKCLHHGQIFSLYT